MFRTIQSAALTIAMLAAFTLSAAAHDHAQPVENAIILGDLTLSGPFARATLPNAPVGGGYLTITNNGAENDTLISAKSAAAGAVQLHNMEMQNNVMRMFEMKNGIPIPAGETVTLMPGGLHIMFMGLTGPFTEGAQIPVTLTFEKAGAIDIMLDVKAVGATSAAPSSMDMSHGH